MAHKWTLKEVGENMDVYCRNIDTLIESNPYKCNNNIIKTHIGQYLHYVVSYGNIGDIICYNNEVFVILPQANA